MNYNGVYCWTSATVRPSILILLNFPLVYRCMYTEDHRSSIYCVQFNHLVKGVSVFACVGTNRVSVYECLREKLKLLQVYADPDVCIQVQLCPVFLI